VEWTGQAASILGVSALRAANWTTSAGDLAGSSGSQIQQYGQSYEETKAKVPEPKAASYGFGDAMTDAANGMTFGVFDMQSDYQKTRTENKAADDAANRALYAHESVARASYESIPVVDPTPDIAISAPRQGGRHPVRRSRIRVLRRIGRPPRHDRQPRVKPYAPTQFWQWSRSTTEPAQWCRRGAARDDDGPSVATTTSGFQVSPVSAEISAVPTQGFPAGRPQGNRHSRWCRWRLHRRYGRVGFVSARCCRGWQLPAARSRHHIWPECGHRRGCGRVHARCRATSRSDNGQIMQPAAGKGKKDSDQEHRDRFGRKSDDIFLDGIPTVTPPVIGENP